MLHDIKYIAFCINGNACIAHDQACPVLLRIGMVFSYTYVAAANMLHDTEHVRIAKWVEVFGEALFNGHAHLSCQTVWLLCTYVGLL